MAGLYPPVRPLRWIGSSRKDYGEFPARLQETFGFGLYLAQTGLHPLGAKPLKGLGGGIVELVEALDGDAYRAVYTVRFDSAVYVLHCFKKKSRSGIKTPHNEVVLIRRRLRDAEADYGARQRGE